MRDALEAFLASIPNSGEMVTKHNEAVALFGFFLSELLGKTITAAAITECYAAARLRPPRNVSDAIGKSGAFLKGKGGWILHRDAIQRCKSLLPSGIKAEVVLSDEKQKKTVMVVYGQDEETRLDMFHFLRSLGLQPMEWNSAVGHTRKASPFVGEILTKAFCEAQAFLVLMTPDEETVLRPELRKKPRDGDVAYQPRPNVILEAGMALATDEARTILVSTGTLRGMSDLDGRHVIHLDNSPERRNDLVQRLRIAGCDPKTEGPDWIKTGNFERFR